ncbi:MAG: hypothetical protein WAX89_01255, partial [Alphaproteobacteria bacterium]
MNVVMTEKNTVTAPLSALKPSDCFRFAHDILAQQGKEGAVAPLYAVMNDPTRAKDGRVAVLNLG